MQSSLDIWQKMLDEYETELLKIQKSAARHRERYRRNIHTQYDAFALKNLRRMQNDVVYSINRIKEIISYYEKEANNNGNKKED